MADKCDALFGHAWRDAHYQDPKLVAKGKLRQVCTNNLKGGGTCTATRMRTVAKPKKVVVYDKKGRRETEVVKREINAFAGGKLARQTPDGNTQKKGCGKTVKQTVGFMFLVVFLMIKIRKWSHRG